MTFIDAVSDEDVVPTTGEVKQTVEYTRRLLMLAAEIFPRISKAGPKGHNHISGWVELSSYDLTHLEKKYWGEKVAERSFKSAARVARQISMLFSGAIESWDEKIDSIDRLHEEISQHNFSNGLNEGKLKHLQKVFGFLAFSDPLRESEIKFILRVCQKLMGQTRTEESFKVVASNNEFGAPAKTEHNGKWLWSAKGLLVGSVGFLFAASILLMVVFSLGQNKATPQLPSSAALVKNADSSNITESEARYRLDVLWENGSSFAAKGNDEMYFSSMKGAYDLAADVFGAESIEFARASNHMVGAYETTGHPDPAIEVSRQALRLFQKILGPKSPEALSEQVNLGARLARKNGVDEKKESKELLIDALTKYASLDKVSSMKWGYAHALEAYSIYFEEVGDWTDAVLQSEKAVAMIEAADAKTQINRGWIIATHAHMLLQSGNCPAAITMYQRAIAAYVQARVPITQRDHAQSLLLVDRGCG